MDYSDEELRRKAEKRAEEKIGFYTHFAIYIIVNLFLIAIWAVTGAGFPWFIFPLFGWGIGITAHFVSVFAGTGFAERLAEKEYERLKGRKT